MAEFLVGDKYEHGATGYLEGKIRIGDTFVKAIKWKRPIKYTEVQEIESQWPISLTIKSIEAYAKRFEELAGTSCYVELEGDFLFEKGISLFTGEK